MVNSDQRRQVFREPLNQPFRNPLACPVSSEARRRRDFGWIAQMVRRVDTQALEAGVARFRPRIVNPDIPIERSFHSLI